MTQNYRLRACLWPNWNVVQQWKSVRLWFFIFWNILTSTVHLCWIAPFWVANAAAEHTKQQHWIECVRQDNNANAIDLFYSNANVANLEETNGILHALENHLANIEKYSLISWECWCIFLASFTRWKNSPTIPNSTL